MPRLAEAQRELLAHYDEVSQSDGLPIDMDCQPGDVQWLPNHAALHSRTSYEDFAEVERRRHLLRLWLRRDVGRPLVEGFGKNSVVQGRDADRSDEEDAGRIAHIASAAVPDMNWDL